jgi:superfamily II DNA or RNA helicase
MPPKPARVPKAKPTMAELYKRAFDKLKNSETKLRNILIGYEIIDMRSILHQMKESKKKLIPEGYFKSIHSGRLVKDTEKNRFREMLPPEDIVGSTPYYLKIIKKIDSEKDPIDHNVLLREYNVDRESLVDQGMTDWRYLTQTSKIYILKKMNKNSSTDKSKHSDKFAKPKEKIVKESKDKPLRARNMTTFVSKPEGRDLLSDTIDDSEWKDLMTIQNSANIVLRDYQIKAINHMRNHHGLVMAFDVGTGKTITSVMISLLMLHFGIVKKVYVIAPKSLSSNFYKELGYYIDTEDELYEKIECFTHNKFTNIFAETPEKCDDCLLIVDEASEFRTPINSSSQTGKSAHIIINCCIRAKKVLCLSATPLYNEFGDITNLIAMVKGENPKMMPPSFKRKMEYVKDCFTFHNMVEDNEASGKKNVLPERREHTHEFTMSDEYYKEYLKIQRSQNDNSSDPFAFLTGLRHGTNCIKPNPKIDWALDRIRDLGLKTILYSSFIDDGIRLLQEGLIARAIKYETISGELDLKIRETAVKKYNSDEVNVLIISKAGSLGLDLKKTREIIFIEANWNPSQEEQVMGRACRLGSHDGLPLEELFVDIHRLYLFKPSIEKLAAGDNYPSADSILKGILERKKKSLEIYYYLLRSSDIDPDKASKYRKKFDELEKDFIKAREAQKPQPSGVPPRGGPYGPPPRTGIVPYVSDRKILGVPDGASVEECRRAFRKHAMDLHPDRNYNDTAAEREAKLLLFKKISNAMDRIDPK